MSGPAPVRQPRQLLFGAALARRAWKGKADTARRLDRKSHPQGRAGKDCHCRVEDVAQSLGGERAMRRAERRQRDLQLAIGDADVTCRGEQLMGCHYSGRATDVAKRPFRKLIADVLKNARKAKEA